MTARDDGAGSHGCRAVGSNQVGSVADGPEVRMGKAASAALAARLRARQRSVEAGAEQASRELRLSAAAADVHRAQEAIDGARERAALAVAAARAVEHDEVATAMNERDAAVRRAAAEGLTVAKVSELVGLPAADVRRILRTRPGQPLSRPVDGPAS